MNKYKEMKDDAVRLLKTHHYGLKIGEISELGERVAVILDNVWDIKNLCTDELQDVMFSNNLGIEFVKSGDVPYIPLDKLAWLIVASHKLNVDFTLRSVNDKLEITFTRMNDWRSYTDVNDYISNIAEYCPAIDDKELKNV